MDGHTKVDSLNGQFHQSTGDGFILQNTVLFFCEIRSEYDPFLPLGRLSYAAKVLPFELIQFDS